LANRKRPNQAAKGESPSESPNLDNTADTVVEGSEIDATTNDESDSGDKTVAPEADPNDSGAPMAEGVDTTESEEPVEADVSDDEAKGQTDKETGGERTLLPAPTPVPAEPARASVLPMILAGILTALLGFLAARSDFLPASLQVPAPEADPAIAQGIADANDRLSDLETAIAELPAMQPPVVVDGQVDLTPVTDELTALSEQVAALAPLSERLDVLTARVDTLVAQPAPAVAVPDEALEAAMAELRAAAAAQQSEIDRLLADAQSIRNDTAAEANATLIRAAMTRIRAAIDTGAPFATALGDLEQAGATDIPDALRMAAGDGVVPLAALQEAVSDAARDALAAARDVGDDNGGLGSFLQRQLGARAVTPREGSDPNSVLSRVEGAVRAGRLGDALAEAEALPESARAAMGQWLEQAQSRQDAVTAANALAERLSAL